MLAGQSPGWVMPRFAVPGERHVYAEIRPDKPVITGPPTRHWHGVRGEEPEELKANTDVQTLLKGTEAYRQHVRRVDRTLPEGAPSHAEVKGVHEHPDEAKYVFPPSPKMDIACPHDHRSNFYADYPEELARHIAYWHTDPDLMEGDASARHTHYRRVKDHSNSLARRLDIHPMALERLEAAEVVYFALEGVLKADAILSAIIREGRNESVFDVPSVSLWHAKELKGFARNYLKGKTVIIVPDADWIDNDLVIAHARSAEIFLRKLGIRCYVAAPPLGEDNKMLRNASGDKLKGVDDYLAEGYSLDSLAVMQRSDSPEIVYERRRLEDRSRWDGRKLNETGLDTDERVIRKLAYFANPKGYVKTAHEKLGDIMGVAQSTVTEHIKALMKHGWITAEVKVEDVWEPATDIPRTATRYITLEGYYIYTSEDWRDSTRLIVCEDLRAVDHDPITIGELLERPSVEAERRRRIEETKQATLEAKREAKTPRYSNLMDVAKRKHKKGG